MVDMVYSYWHKANFLGGCMRENLINELIEVCLHNCRDDSVYNDNTLYDLLMYGSKGFMNCSDDELQEALLKENDWRKLDENS